MTVKFCELSPTSSTTTMAETINTKQAENCETQMNNPEKLFKNTSSNVINAGNNCNSNTSYSMNSSGNFNKQGDISTKTKKQMFLEQRAQRERDPKVRCIGIDKEALDAQVREKEALKELENSRNAFYDRQALMQDKHACTLQHEINKIRAARERELIDYRNTYQRRDGRREWDLNDPQGKGKELPARIGDDDPRNSVSGLQKFDGEDLDYHARRRAQQRQQQVWAQQQMEEKLVKRWLEEDANNAYDARNEETNYRIYLIEQKIADERKERDCAQAEFNKALSTEKENEMKRIGNEDTLRGLQEIDYQMNCDLLTEKETVVNGELGASVKSERYKGLSEKQKEQFHTEQHNQLEQIRRRRLMEVEDELQWAQQENMQLRMAAALDRQRARERKTEAKELALTQKQQAAAATQRRKELDSLYTNAVDEDYYKYWDQCM